jgi:hypothetical protein
MPAIADQVATIEHDLSIAQTLVDSLRSENAQLKNALAALNVDHGALQAKHADALSLVEETRQLADQTATAALTMLKASRRAIGSPAPQYSWKSVSVDVPLPQDAEAAVQVEVIAREQQMKDDMAANWFGDSSEKDDMAANLFGDSSEKTDVRPDLPIVEDPELCDHTAAEEKAPFVPEATITETGGTVMRAEDFVGTEMTNAERFRAHMPGEDPLPIFLKPRALPENVLG